MHILTSERAYPGGYSEYEKPLSILDIAGIIKRHWLMVALTTLASILAAGLYVVTTTPVFTATARLLLEPKTQNVFNPQTRENLITLDTPHVESQLAILKSERIAEIVVRRIGDDLEFDLSKPGMRAWLYSRMQAWSSRILGFEEDEADKVNTKTADRAAADVLKKIQVNRVGLSFAIDVSYASHDPELSAKVANAVVDAYIEDQLAAQASAARKSAEWLQRHIAGLRKEINATALTLKQLKSRRDYRIGSRKYDDASADDANMTGELGGSARELTIEELELRSDTYKKLYEGYLAAYWQSIQRESSPFSAARAITDATSPMSKSHPRTLLILAFAAAAGAFAGLGLVFVRHSLKSEG